MGEAVTTPTVEATSTPVFDESIATSTSTTDLTPTSTIESFLTLALASDEEAAATISEAQIQDDAETEPQAQDEASETPEAEIPEQEETDEAEESPEVPVAEEATTTPETETEEPAEEPEEDLEDTGAQNQDANPENNENPDNDKNKKDDFTLRAGKIRNKSGKFLRVASGNSETRGIGFKEFKIWDSSPEIKKQNISVDIQKTDELMNTS